jgi:hypothetical protein
MKRTFIVGFILIISVLGLAACGSVSSSSQNPASGMQLATLSANGSTAAVSTPAASPESHGDYFTDDFSDPESGWVVSTSENGSVGYQDGTYVVEAKNNQVIIWGRAHREFEDVLIDTDVQVPTGEANDDNAISVDCRVQENGNGYSFEISSDGMYGIHKFTDDGTKTLVPWTSSQNVPTGNQVIHLTALCRGEELFFWVNHVPVAYAHDDEFSSGDVSLSASSMKENKPTRAVFTNYSAADPNTDAIASVNLSQTQLSVINNSGQVICLVHAVDPASPTWGQDLLGDDQTIPDGMTQTFPVYFPGLRDVNIEECNYHSLYIGTNVDFSQDVTITVPDAQQLQDWEFTGTDRAWITGNTHSGHSALTNDDYLSLYADRPNQMVEIMSNNFSIADVVMVGSATLVNDTEDNLSPFGLMCRVQPNGDGIFFAISGDGHASIRYVKNGYSYNLTYWEVSDAVNQGVDANIIEGDCIGETFTLYVNGSYIGETHYQNYVSGKVGLALMGYPDVTQVDFDFLKLYAPQEN